MQQDEQQKTKRISQIAVTNLFGIFNHVIPLNMGSNITIIHGPNGFGKTMMLRLLAALFSPDTSTLYEIPFDEFKVVFDDNTSFWISKTPALYDSSGEENHSPVEEITFHMTGKESYSRQRTSLNGGIHRSWGSIPIEVSGTIIYKIGDIFTTDGVPVRVSDQWQKVLANERLESIPAWLLEVRQIVPIRLIETQRLLSLPKPSRRNEKTQTSEYAVTEDAEHLFLYKSMTVNKEQGFVFTAKNGAVLPLESLSSGEQHELVLFYELLFRVAPGSLILIDEPELSLHVVWQEQFLKDVQQITKLTNIDVVLATHSPDIIGSRRDWVVELAEPENSNM